MNNLNIMIVGVGGQGTLLASRILGNGALNMGYDVKVSEVHGMAQRGGSVVTYVRLGEKVFSPIIEKGEADIILAFEQLEALRWADYLKPEGTFIINTQKINPMPVIMGKAKYPESIIDKIRSRFERVLAFDALSVAKQTGNIKAVNVVLLGVLAKLMESDMPKQIWIDSMKQVIPEKLQEPNFIAFEKGYSMFEPSQAKI